MKYTGKHFISLKITYRSFEAWSENLENYVIGVQGSLLLASIILKEHAYLQVILTF